MRTLFVLLSTLSVLSQLLSQATAAFNAHDTLKLKHEATHIIHIGDGYGFGPGGIADLTLNNIYVSGGKGEDVTTEGKGSEFKIYFLLRKYGSASSFAEDYEKALEDNTCIAIDADGKGKDGDILLDASDQTKWNVENSISHAFSKEDEGLYFLTFQRCDPVGSDDKHRVTFEFTHHFRNVDSGGNIDYLSAGSQPLPKMFLGFAIIYASCLAIWIYRIAQAKKEEYGEGNSAIARVKGVFGDFRQDIRVHHIHHMMSMLLTLKTITVFAESARYHYIRVTGSGEAWSVIFYIFTFLKGIMLFVVILLIGSGWSFVKPFLNGKEKRIIFAVLVLQVLDNIALLVVASDAPGSSSYTTWENVLHFVDIICCCAILFPIVWQVRALEAAVEADGKAERSIQKLTLFRQFYITVVCYIYFTRILIYLVATVLTYKATWLRYFFSELATVAFYVITGWKFRPKENNPYLQVKNDDSDDDEESGLNLEEFGLKDGEVEAELTGGDNEGPHGL